MQITTTFDNKLQENPSENYVSTNPAEDLANFFNTNTSHLASLLWELGRQSTEINTGFSIDSLRLNSLEEIVAHPEMCDVMLAKVCQIGHRDAFPKAYHWENLIQTLSPGEELLWIVHSPKGKTQSFELYVGLKFNKSDLECLDELKARELRFQVFCDNFTRRIFPESTIILLPPTRIDDKSGCASQKIKELVPATDSHVFSVIGMPSLKDTDTEKVIAERKEDARPFSSLNDILEPHINIDAEDWFTLVFSISAGTAEDIEYAFRNKFELCDAIKPLTNQEFNASSNRSISRGLSITPAHEQENNSTSYQDKAGLLTSFVRGARGTVKWVKGEWKAVSPVESSLLRKIPLLGNLLKEPPSADLSHTNSKTIIPEVRAESEQTGETTGLSQTIHVTHSDLVFLDKQLELGLKHLQQMLGGGGFYATAMVYTDSQPVGLSLARSIRAALSGSNSFLRPMQIFQFEKSDFFQLNYNISIADLLRFEGIQQEILNKDSACLALLLPDSDLPDNIKLKKSTFYARPEEKRGEEVVRLGNISYFENLIGRYDSNANNLDTGRQLAISQKDIYSHTFVVGTPGGGKSERTKYILNNLPEDIRLVVLETAKREYADCLYRNNKKLIRYTLGNSQIHPLRINPFFFDWGTSLKEHIAILSDAIADLLPMEALIGPKLREATEACYRRCNWNIETGMPLNENFSYPDMLMFNSEVNKICESLKEYGPEVKANYKGALKNRAGIFLDDVYQDIFAYDGNKTLDELFPPDADVVIEMEDMPPSEINMPAFIISVVLQRIRAYRKQREYDASTHGFLIAVEEAHNVLSRKIESSGGDERQSGKGGFLLKQVIRLLAEGRGLKIGVMVIDQSTQAIASSVLANTNTKIVFRQEDGEEIKTIGNSIGLPEKEWPNLQRLVTGECIVKSKAAPMPIKLAPLPESNNDILPLLLREDEDISPTVNIAPYVQCEKMLNEIFSTVRSDSAMQKAVAVFAQICGNQFDLMRYIFGKYLIASKYAEEYELLLNQHLDNALYVNPQQSTTPYNTISNDNKMEYMKLRFLQAMKDEQADYFVNVIHGNKDNMSIFLANDFCDGAEKLRRIMIEDLPEHTKDVNDLFARINAINWDKNLDEQFAEWLNAISMNEVIYNEYLAVTSHVWNNLPSVKSELALDELLKKYIADNVKEK